MNAGLTGIIPFTYFGGANKAVGSTFLRVEGLIENDDSFKMWKHGHSYDNLIFQKAYWPEMMQTFKGPKILDLCDADWINGEVDIVHIAGLADAITCSSPELTALLKTFLPSKIIVHVPDRLNFKIVPEPRPAHTGRAKNVIWFGFINNAYQTLEQLYPAVSSHNLNLTIVSDLPYTKNDPISSLNPQFIRYDQSTAYSIIKNADIVLNPRSSRGNYQYKSNNKSVIGWKLGVPVAETIEDIERLLDHGQRNKEVFLKQSMVNEHYNILKSADQYHKIICEIKSKNKSQLGL